MFGAAGRIANAGTEIQEFTVNEGTWNFILQDYYGFTTDPGSFFGSTYGSRSPTTFKDETFEEAYYIEAGGTDVFVISFASTLLTADFFESVLPEGGTELYAGDATFSTAAGYAEWRWNSAGSRPAGWDGASTSTLLMRAYR